MKPHRTTLARLLISVTGIASLAFACSGANTETAHAPITVPEAAPVTTLAPATTTAVAAPIETTVAALPVDAAPETTIAPTPAPVDWANHTFDSPGLCVTPLTLTGGSFTDDANLTYASLANVWPLSDGRQIIHIACTMGVSGRGGGNTFLLVRGETILDTTALDNYMTSVAAVGDSIVASSALLIGDDPMCCPTGHADYIFDIAGDRFARRIPTTPFTPLPCPDLTYQGVAFGTQFSDDHATVANFQQALVNLGFGDQIMANGGVDGLFGGGTLAAFESWLNVNDDGTDRFFFHDEGFVLAPTSEALRTLGACV